MCLTHGKQSRVSQLRLELRTSVGTGMMGAVRPEIAADTRVGRRHECVVVLGLLVLLGLEECDLVVSAWLREGFDICV